MFFGFGLVAVLCLVLWVMAIVDILNSRFREDSNRILWILLVIFLPFIGTILYYAIGRQQRI
jgi:hypothetical protein